MKQAIIVVFLICIIKCSQCTFIKTNEQILSSEPHYDNTDNHMHNTQYDHQAFLGQEKAKEFDELSPEESKERLSKIYDNIDKDNDGLITETELRDWIKYTHLTDLQSHTNERMTNVDVNNDGYATWEEYSDYLYNYYTELGYDDLTDEQYNNTLDQIHFKYADINKDDKLTMDELSHFMYPTYSDHMKEALKERKYNDKMTEFDSNEDGFISGKEFHDFRWFGNQGDKFTSTLDHNKDGKLDKTEVLDWIDKDDFVELETNHLIKEADSNMDSMLTKDEVLEKHDVFVGSKTKHKDVDGLLGHSEKYKTEL